jgi:Zn-dependent protease/predicted transcriptional regulator
MGSRWRIGRIFGINIFVDSSWIVIFLLFTWLVAGEYFPRLFPGGSKAVFWGLGVLTSLLLFASVLIHELFHSVVALKQGERVDNITLFILGGVSQIVDEPKKPMQELSMAVVGPLASLLLGALFFGLSRLLRAESPILAAASSYLALLNAGLGVFNLMPGFPMDGGRVLRSILWQATGNLKKATRTASLVGQGFSFLIIFLGVVQILRGIFGGLWFILIGWFLHSAAVRGYDQMVVKQMLAGVRARELMSTDYTTVGPDLAVQSLVDDHILKKRESVFLVQDGQDLKGIVCLDDIKAAPRQDWMDTKVQDIMTARDRLEAVKPDSDGSEVLKSLTDKNVNQVPVMDGNRVAGIICRTDFLRYIKTKTELGG